MYLTSVDFILKFHDDEQDSLVWADWQTTILNFGHPYCITEEETTVKLAHLVLQISQYNIHVDLEKIWFPVIVRSRLQLGRYFFGILKFFWINKRDWFKLMEISTQY
jgi:hypothetical protein